MRHTGCSKTSPLVVVGGILWKGATFLAAQRPKGHSQAGFWEFPGGKVEPGETHEQALIREIDEELSLRVHRVHFWRTVEHRYPQRFVILHFFNIVDFSGDPVPNDGQAFRWVTPAEAEKLPFLDADRPLLKELRAHPYPLPSNLLRKTEEVLPPTPHQ